MVTKFCSQPVQSPLFWKKSRFNTCCISYFSTSLFRWSTSQIQEVLLRCSDSFSEPANFPLFFSRSPFRSKSSSSLSSEAQNFPFRSLTFSFLLAPQRIRFSAPPISVLLAVHGCCFFLCSSGDYLRGVPTPTVR